MTEIKTTITFDDADLMNEALDLVYAAREAAMPKPKKGKR